MKSTKADSAPTISTQRSEQLVLWVLAAAQFINMVDFVIVMPLGPQLMRSLEINPHQFGLIVSSYTITAGLAGLLAALFIDRFDRRTAFLTVLAGFALGTLGCAVANSYPLLLLARAVSGVFGGIIGGLALTIVGDVFPDERRGAATGKLMSSFGLATAIGVPMGLYLSGWFGSWHAPFWMLGIPSLGVLALAAVQLPSLRRHLTAARPNPIREIACTLGHRSHLIALALVATLVGGALMVVPYLGTYYVANCGIPEPDLPWVYVAGGSVTLFTSTIIGKLSDRWGRFSLFSVLAPFSGLIMFGATQVGSTLHGAAQLALVAAVTTVLMVCNSGRMIVAMTMINGAVEPRRRGSFMVLSSAVQHLSSGVGAHLGGMIVGTDEAQALTHFGVVGLIALASALASLPLASRLARRRINVPAQPAGALAGPAGTLSGTLPAVDCCDAA